MPASALFRFTVQNLDATIDAASTDWVYSCSTLSAPTPLLVNDVSVAVNHFFQSTTGGISTPMTGYMSHSINPSTGLAWECYDITAHLAAGSKFGAPIASGNYSILASPAATTPMPEGVAACISYRGNYGTDVEFVKDSTGKVTARPRSRHRGRIFFGPLGAGTMIQDSGTHRTKFVSTFIADALLAFQQALSITDSGSNKWHLSHWSKKNGTVEDLVQVWIDDRPDYQRRRADQSTVRTAVTVTYP